MYSNYFNTSREAVAGFIVSCHKKMLKKYLNLSLVIVIYANIVRILKPLFFYHTSIVFINFISFPYI